MGGGNHGISVKAHVTFNDSMSPLERRLAVGNNCADAAAKAALLCHEPLQPDALRAVNRTVLTARLVLSVAAATLACWPGLPKGLKKLPRSPDAATPASAQSSPPTAPPPSTGRPAAARCGPLPWRRGIARLLANPNGHRIRICTFHAHAHVAVCEVCGAFAEARFERLLAPCANRPSTSFDSSVIKRVSLGWHPASNVSFASSSRVAAALPRAPPARLPEPSPTLSP